MPDALTYDDLKDQIGMRGPRPILLCPECRSEYSANAGDYWDRVKTDVIACAACAVTKDQVPLRLVVREVTFREVRP